MRCVLGADGALAAGERFATFVDPGRPIPAAVARLTGISDAELAGAPSPAEAAAALERFARGACLIGHNVGFDVAFLEAAGLPPGAPRLDTAEIAAILLPTATSYALQRLAADAAIAPRAAHRALEDALTCAALLEVLVARLWALPPAVLEEARAYAPLIGPVFASLVDVALTAAVRSAWSEPIRTPPPLVRRAPRGARPDVAAAFAADGPLAGALEGYEDRAEQRAMAEAVERTMRDGGVLVAEAGTGTGKSVAYLVPALGRALAGERVVVSTHTLPLQEQLVHRDVPALQAALGTDVAVAVLKGRANYLCPRRWQLLRSAAATGDEARLVLKTLVWRTETTVGDRAELNLTPSEAALWPRISADDESCEARRCARTPGGCYLERARERAAAAGVVVVNHALLLHDARMRSALLPETEHVVVDEAHRLEDVAADTFGHRLDAARLRRDLDRVARATLVAEALRDPSRAALADDLRAEVARARERAAETFAALAALLPAAWSGGEDRLRVTTALRGVDDRWLAVEVAAERLADALAGTEGAADRLAATAADEDAGDELRAAASALSGARAAVERGIHAPRPHDVAWVASEPEPGAVTLHVAPAHVGQAVRRLVVERHRSVVLTSATLAVAGDLGFTAERLGVEDVAERLRLGSPFDFAAQAQLILPTDIADPREPEFPADAAALVEEIARAIDGRTLVLFTSHAALRDVASRLGALEDGGIAVLAQGLDGSRRALLDRYRAGRAVLLGTQSFWEGVDLPGEQLRCVVVARLPFAVPDDPLVAGRAERYDDPFREFHLPQAVLRLRQGFGRLIRRRTDRGSVVLLDRRVITQQYGSVFLGSLPEATVRRATLGEIPSLVASWGVG